MLKTIGMILIFGGLSSLALADISVPEINASSAANALALLSGAILVIRGRKK